MSTPPLSSPPSLELPTASGQPAVPEGARWFSEEVQSHEGKLRGYLRRTFPSVHDIDDVVQESYLRVWKTRAAQPIRSAQAFLFKVAARVALDLVRKSKHSPLQPVSDFQELDVIDEARDVSSLASLHEKSYLLAEALVTLPPRSRQIIMLCKIQGKLRREVAEELGISERTVDVHLYRGYQRIEAYLRSRGVDGAQV